MSDQFSRMSDQNLLLLRMSQNGKKVISTVRGRRVYTWGNEGEGGGGGGRGRGVYIYGSRVHKNKRI